MDEGEDEEEVNGEDDEEVNMEINADPSPPPDITESIVAQTQLLQRLTEATEQQINVDHH